MYDFFLNFSFSQTTLMLDKGESNIKYSDMRGRESEIKTKAVTDRRKERQTDNQTHTLASARARARAHTNTHTLHPTTS